MIIRESYEPLRKHLKSRLITVITGMRRVGKSTAVRYLLGLEKSENHLFLDCERVEVRSMLNRQSYASIIEEMQLLGMDFSKPAVIAIDEIQLVENLPSLIKYIYDTYRVKFIVTGSSAYYMKNRFSESLAGRKKIFELFPLRFSEFLLFRGADIRTSWNYRWKTFNEAWYNRCKELYEEYVQYGGFPEVAIERSRKSKRDYLRDIINSYIELDVKMLYDYSASDDLYRLAKLLAARVGSKMDYSKLGSVAGINRLKVREYLDLFEYTYFIYRLTPFSRNIDREISQQPKFYFSDTGILNELAGTQISSGQLFENAIAAQLKPQGDLKYYQKKSGQEIDFILNDKKAIEVKETAVEHDLAVLKMRSHPLRLKDIALISRYVPLGDFRSFIWGGNVF